MKQIGIATHNEFTRRALSIFYQTILFIEKCPGENTKTYCKPGQKFYLQTTEYVSALDGKTRIKMALTLESGRKYQQQI